MALLLLMAATWYARLDRRPWWMFAWNMSPQYKAFVVRLFRLGAVVMIVFGVLSIVGIVRDDRRCATPVDDPSVTVTTGVVTDFHPMPATGHASETFRVNTASFEFSGFETSCSFHQAAAFGGPLREGLPVRVFHKDGRILRLDVVR